MHPANDNASRQCRVPQPRELHSFSDYAALARELTLGLAPPPLGGFAAPAIDNAPPAAYTRAASGASAREPAGSARGQMPSAPRSALPRGTEHRSDERAPVARAV